MKIVHITPGTGGTFYCQNCIRDQELVKALRKMGHDVIMTQLYLPPVIGEDVEADGPVFYGAINLYLGQKYAWFRKLPGFIKKIFDTKPFLNWAAKKAGTTRAEALEEMTVSMLEGENGNQARELEQMIQWLKQEGNVDIIHLSDALLLGVAGRCSRELDIPVVCSVMDEDQWVDAMPEPWCTRVWDKMAEKARDAAAFVSVSEWYAHVMKKRLDLPDEKMETIYIGIDLDGRPQTLLPDDPVIGYLNRNTSSLGLGVLLDAFTMLKEQEEFKGAKLHISGGFTGDDLYFRDQIRDRIHNSGFEGSIEYFERFDREGRDEFMKGLTLFCTPVPKGEAFGLGAVEAMACGVPVLMPDTGAFREIVELAGGGKVYPPDGKENLFSAMKEILSNRKQLQTYSNQGKEGVNEHFSVQKMAERTISLYKRLVKK